MNAVQPRPPARITSLYKLPGPLKGQRLTDREHEVMLLFCSGKSSKEVAAHLGRSVKTVEKQKTAIHIKWAVHNTIEMLHQAVRGGHYVIEGQWPGNPS